MTSEKPLRLFVAIELPDAWLEALREVQERMKAALAQDPALADLRMRWVRPDVIHLTLKFIGEVAPEGLTPIREQLAHAVPEPPEIVLSLAGAGSFEDRRAPRVVWAGVLSQPQWALLRLAEGIETWLAAAGIPRDRRGFLPHLTLARLPDGLSDAQRRRAAEVTTAVTMPEIPAFHVKGVSLIQSVLGPGGARYERMGRWPR